VTQQAAGDDRDAAGGAIPPASPARALSPRAVWTRVGVMWALGAAFLAGSSFGTWRATAERAWGPEHLLGTALDSVRVNYLDSLPEEVLLRRAVTGMLRELGDPYAALLEGDGATHYRGTLRGEGQGLGLLLRLRGRDVLVRRVAPGSPAAQAGLRAGDAVLAVDGVTAADAWQSSRPTAGAGGAPADSIRLVVARGVGGDTTDLTLVRSPWRAPAVPEALLLGSGVGYARLSSVAKGSAEELEQAVAGLRERGMTSLVLDLRGNAGGLYDEGVHAASLFLERGQLVTSLERRGERGLEPQIARRSRWPQLPLVLLVDRHTASSAELIAAALRDHGRALLIGENTYGKGLVQRVVPIDRDLSLRLTTARWLPPSRQAVTRREELNGRVTGGLTPDVRVPGTGRLDPSAVPGALSPVLARALSDAVDEVVARAMRDGWAGAPIVLLERRVRDLLMETLTSASPDPVRRAALLGDGVRVAVRRLLEMTRGDEALWAYAAADDAGLRAALDVVAPTWASTRPVDSTGRRPTTTVGLGADGDSLARERLDRWAARRFGGQRLAASDTAGVPPAGRQRIAAPRLEGRLVNSVTDTLVAVHFADAGAPPAFDAGRTVWLADPSGGTTALAVKVVARHGFVAPRVPRADPAQPADWRHGWAYLVVAPQPVADGHPAGFAGWQLAGAAPHPVAATASAVRRRAPRSGVAPVVTDDARREP
jgi:carboxyl-terminal processing protease